MRLLVIEADGSVEGFEGKLGESLAAILKQTVDMYASTGFEKPWISYLAIDEDTPVGMCSFKSPPVDERVEIAYFTFPNQEGRGIATAMASRLVTMAREHSETLRIAAQTPPRRSASHRVLEKLGFQSVGAVEHPEDGTVLEWQLPRFRAFREIDRTACLRMFDQNCPEFFAPNEREDYATFLRDAKDRYVVSVLGVRVIGAYGLDPNDDGGSTLRWVLVSPSAQGGGLGSLIMARVLAAMRSAGRSPLRIGASHKSAPFFSKFGATEISREKDGWGPGMHRVEMALVP
jgi:RimJ/RimL family protein N-acetyltransferase